MRIVKFLSSLWRGKDETESLRQTRTNLQILVTHLCSSLAQLESSVPERQDVQWSDADLERLVGLARDLGGDMQRFAGDARHGLVNVRRILSQVRDDVPTRLAVRDSYQEYWAFAMKALDRLDALLEDPGK